MNTLFKRLTVFFVLTFGPSLEVNGSLAFATDTSLLTGDVRLACEAILCLAASRPTHECNPALSHFFSIEKRKLSDTLKAREHFLSLCPSATASAQMSSLIKAMARGAGRCNAETLNLVLTTPIGRGGDAGYDRTVILDRMPAYCTAYIQHEYVRITDDLPRYVGKPDEEGFWVEAAAYDKALKKYEREQAIKKARRENYGWGGN